MPDNPFTFLALSGRDADCETVRALTGGGKVLEFNLSYVPPYEDFRGIRELQLAVRRMGAFPPEALVIDLTEWEGHEEEEYFEIAAMYLRDHRDLWNYVFLARELDGADCAMLFFTLRTFLDGRMEEDRTFSDRESLSAYLARQTPFAPGTTERLAGILLQPGARMLRSYPRVQALLKELSRGGKITEAKLDEAVGDPASVLHLIAGRDAGFRPVRPERSVYGKEAI